MSDFSSTFRVCDPNNVQMTLTVTMSMRNWKRLAEQLDSDYPSWKLHNAIKHLVEQGEKVLMFDSSDEKPNE